MDVMDSLGCAFTAETESSIVDVTRRRSLELIKFATLFKLITSPAIQKIGTSHIDPDRATYMPEIESRSSYIDPALVSLFEVLRSRLSHTVVLREIDLLNVHWGSSHRP